MSRRAPTVAAGVLATLALLAVAADEPGRSAAAGGRPPSIVPNATLPEPERPAAEGLAGLTIGSPTPRQLLGTAQTVILFGLMSLAPAALLMMTAYVRISIVLTLLRQALGSPQVPGNQVLMALALLLTALVMKPVAVAVYDRGIEPLLAERITPAAAWEAGTSPLKGFMIDQICRTHHEDYITTLDDLAAPDAPDRAELTEYEQYPLGVIAPAFLLSELTTALVIGFAIYLPFLVIDLVVSTVLSATSHQPPASTKTTSFSGGATSEGGSITRPVAARTDETTRSITRNGR